MIRTSLAEILLASDAVTTEQLAQAEAVSRQSGLPLPEVRALRAALRRAPAQDADDSTPHLIEAGDFRVNLETRVVNVQGREVHLTPKEYELLVYLVRHHGKVLTHHTLLGAVWGGDSVEQTEYLRVFVGQLRKKIEPDPAKPRYILTEPWIGYRFDPGA